MFGHVITPSIIPMPSHAPSKAAAPPPSVKITPGLDAFQSTGPDLVGDLDRKMQRLQKVTQSVRRDPSNALRNLAMDLVSKSGKSLEASSKSALQDYQAYRAALHSGDGATALELQKRLLPELRKAEADLGAYQESRNKVSHSAGTAATVGTVALTGLLTAGTGVPLALTVAGGTGALTRVTTGRLIQGEQYEDAKHDALAGFAQGAGEQLGGHLAEELIVGKTVGAMAGRGALEKGVTGLTEAAVEGHSAAHGALDGATKGVIMGPTKELAAMGVGLAKAGLKAAILR